MSRAVVVLVAIALVATPVAAQQLPPAADGAQLLARLTELQAMAHTAVGRCQQIDAGCQDVWCLTNPAFDAHVTEWPEARAVAALCEQYHPDGDQSSVRELEPTLGDTNEFPRGGWTTVGACDDRGGACQELSVGRSDLRLARLRVVVPYGPDRRFAEVVVLLERQPAPAHHAAWIDPRPAPRADAALMERHRSELRQLALLLAPSCGASLGEGGTRGTPLQLSTTVLATWPGWPTRVDVSIACSHATGPATTSGWLMAQRGALAFAGGDTTPWGPVDARCIHPGRPCEEYVTVAGDPHLVMFHVEVRTPGDRGFVSAQAFLHSP